MPILPLLLASLPVAAVPEARAAWVGRSALAPDAETRWIPFELTPGNQIRFTMAVDGRPVTAILDTGVSYSVLAQRYAAAHRLVVRPEGRAAVIGGTVNIGRVATNSVTLGAVTRRGGGLAVAELPASATGTAQPVDLLVGRDLTAGYALDINYPAHRFRLLRSGSRPFVGAAAPLAIAPDLMVYLSAVTIGSQRIGPMVVDTGDGAAITLDAAGWAAARALAGATTTSVSIGLAGPVVSEMAILPELRIGDVVAHDVEVRAESKGGFSDTIGVAGRIGSGFLQRYRVLLDPQAGVMLLGATPASDTPALRSTSGLLLTLAGDRLSVLHVMRGGPAEAGGWKAGDTICAVDGERVTRNYPRLPLARWSAGEPGRVVTLQSCDGITRKLTLRRFY